MIMMVHIHASFAKTRVMFFVENQSKKAMESLCYTLAAKIMVGNNCRTAQHVIKLMRYR